MRSALLLVLPLLVACGGGQPEPAAPAPEPPASAAPAPPPPDASATRDKATETPPVKLEPSPPVVTLVEAGAAPKRALRYEFKKGAVEWLDTDMKMILTMTADDRAAPKTSLPPIRTAMKLETKDVTPAGDATIAFEVAKVDLAKEGALEPAMRQKLESELSSIAGLHGTTKVSPRGIASDIEFALPDSASPMMKQQVENVRDAVRQIYSPLPEEEVGAGATWDVGSRVLFGTTVADFKSHVTLEKLEPTIAKLAFENSVNGPPNQELDLPSLPPGAVARLDTLVAKGAGKASTNFKKLVSTVDVKTNVVSVVSIRKDTDAMKMKSEIDMALTMKPGKAVAAPAKKK